MKGDAKVVRELDECLKYERTLEDCFDQYSHYFARWRIARLADWMHGQAKQARHRKCHLLDRINQLDSVPGSDRYEIEVEPLKKAGDIKRVVEYFAVTLTGARDAYETARQAAKGVEDTVTAKLCGRGKQGIEESLWRVEAKEFRIDLIGPELYLGFHLH